MKEAFEKMKEQIIELEGKGSPRVNMGKVKPFSGEKGIFKVFLAQLQIHFVNNNKAIVSKTDKVLTASSFLTGEAMRWFAPYVTDRIENHDEQINPETATIFSSFAYFEEKLNQLFGTVNKELRSIHQIKEIWQYGSVGDYISKFLQVSGYLKWSDQGLHNQFYNNLKDNVKD